MNDILIIKQKKEEKNYGDNFKIKLWKELRAQYPFMKRRKKNS